MGLETECDESGNIHIKYDLQWVQALLSASCTSMVAYAWFSEGSKGLTDSRSYPRSSQSDFTLGEFETKDAKGGGRPHEEGFNLSELGPLLADKTRTIPLCDIAILTKRELCANVTGIKLKTLYTSGGVLDDPPAFGAYGYPMLCILGIDAGQFPVDQSQWRVVQSLFCAVLTYEIRKAEIGLEVVSREGFGSLFPTLADLPTGIRLDPGLLPPVEGAKAVKKALGVVDDFIVSVQEDAPGWLSSPAKWLVALGGMKDSALQAVDRLTSFLHHATTKKGPEGCDYAAILGEFNGSEKLKCLPPCEDLKKMVVEYKIDSKGQATDYKKARRFKKQKVLLRELPELQDEEIDVGGYGSESDYEEDEEEVSPLVLHLKKYSVATGMAALRMAVRYGAEHSVMLYAEKKWVPEELERASGVTIWAPYFELDYKELVVSVKCESPKDISLLIFDGAPNPINIPKEKPPSMGKVQWGAIVIDTTNNTSKEKANFILQTMPLLAQAEESGGIGGLLIMVDSASKHPTGGDLVHGVIRVCGTLAALGLFHKRLTQHLKGGSFQALGQTLLNKNEGLVRRAMVNTRLFTRNLDIFRLVSGLSSEMK